MGNIAFLLNYIVNIGYVVILFVQSNGCTVNRIIYTV